VVISEHIFTLDRLLAIPEKRATSTARLRRQTISYRLNATNKHLAQMKRTPTPTAPPASTDLFSPATSDWQKTPVHAFDTWLAQQGFMHSSAEVYRAQWSNFIAWLTAQKIPLNSATQQNIEHFLLTLEIKQDQRQRYLRLIERVLGQVHRTSFGTENPATSVAQNPTQDWTAIVGNEPTGFLDPEEYHQLVTQLCLELPPVLSAVGQWRELRDRTLVALFAGAGLKMAELQSLTVSCIFMSEGWILIESLDSRFAHRTKMQPFARHLTEQWLILRQRSGTAGALVFPATRAGRPMHKATVLRATADQIEQTGIAAQRVERASPQTLRNSFAAALFESGQGTELVAEWMGFGQVLTAQRLRAAWEVWKERRRLASPVQPE
jgi:site-specific recombinase XerD